MNKKTSKEQQALDQLADALVEDIFDASDEEIMSELAETGSVAEENKKLQESIEHAILKANKTRLSAAKAGAAANRHPSVRTASIVVEIATARERIRGLVGAGDLPHPVTLAARNEEELSDADILSMYEDLVELGILPSISED